MAVERPGKDTVLVRLGLAYCSEERGRKRSGLRAFAECGITLETCITIQTQEKELACYLPQKRDRIRTGYVVARLDRPRHSRDRRPPQFRRVGLRSPRMGRAGDWQQHVFDIRPFRAKQVTSSGKAGIMQLQNSLISPLAGLSLLDIMSGMDALGLSFFGGWDDEPPCCNPY